METKAQHHVTQWLVDIRPHQPSTSTTQTSKQQMQDFAHPSSFTGQALTLLPSSTQKKITSFLFPKDAYMSLTSHLLKHALISAYTSLPFSTLRITFSKDHKPIFLHPKTGRKDFDFNVSHQAGLVNILAVKNDMVDVGTDITCVSERIERVYATINEEGFNGWVDMHAEVFHPREVVDIKYNATHLNLDLDRRGINGYTRDKIYRCLDFGKGASEVLGQGVMRKQVIAAKLRRFYAFWALREAYVKMTGEALLASWLKDLEFKNVRAPVAKTCEEPGKAFSLQCGEVVRDVEIWFKNKRVTDVKVELRAIGNDYMIADCVRNSACKDTSTLALHDYEQLDLEKDVINVSKASVKMEIVSPVFINS